MGKKSRMKKDKNRHKAFLRLRETGFGGMETVTLKNGVEVILNPMKRFLLNKPYLREEYKTHLLRRIGEFAIGKEKMTQLQEMADAREVKKI